MQPELSENALTVLQRRYLIKDEKGEVRETPEELFQRVARAVAAVEAKYGEDPNQWEQTFYEMMASLDFLPNSPALANAGRPLGQLSACFVLPVGDSLPEIFDAIKYAALVHQTGGGTGMSFSNIRPEGSLVRSSSGVASGPVSFLKVFDAATSAIKQGGFRRGANMGVLSCSHPDVLKFINLKADMTTLQNFNISVLVDEPFMEAVAKGLSICQRFPVPEKTVIVEDEKFAWTGFHCQNHHTPARDIWEAILTNAWKNGDPGVIFIDRINDSRANPVPSLGPVVSVNPCGEVPLYNYDSCNLASINLSQFLLNGNVDWWRLGETVEHAIRFLDDVIDANHYPLPQIEEMSKRVRRVGLGVMGWADLLFQLRIPYGSKDSVHLAHCLMDFIQKKADIASQKLTKKRGAYPAWSYSIDRPLSAKGLCRPVRNCTRTCIAPTGTISIIADCSSGIEPAFALVFIRQHNLDASDPNKPTQMLAVNPWFEKVARAEGFYSEDLIRFLAEGGKLFDRPDVPQWAKDVFVTAHDINPLDHVAMQAAFQRFTDNAVSKTVNLPHNATKSDVDSVYRAAWEQGCLGVTVYRDGSRDKQVLTNGKKADTNTLTTASFVGGWSHIPPALSVPFMATGVFNGDNRCPECSSDQIAHGEGCETCQRCGYSACLI